MTVDDNDKDGVIVYDVENMMNGKIKRPEPPIEEHARHCTEEEY